MAQEPMKNKKKQPNTASSKQEKFTDKKRKKAEADRHTRGGF